MPQQSPKKPEPFFARALFQSCPECGELVLKPYLYDHMIAHEGLEVWLGDRFPAPGQKKMHQPEDPFAVLGRTT